MWTWGQVLKDNCLCHQNLGDTDQMQGLWSVPANVMQSLHKHLDNSLPHSTMWRIGKALQQHVLSS